MLHPLHVNLASYTSTVMLRLRASIVDATQRLELARKRHNDAAAYLAELRGVRDRGHDTRRSLTDEISRVEKELRNHARDLDLAAELLDDLHNEWNDQAAATTVGSANMGTTDDDLLATVRRVANRLAACTFRWDSTVRSAVVELHNAANRTTPPQEQEGLEGQQ